MNHSRLRWLPLGGWLGVAALLGGPGCGDDGNEATTTTTSASVGGSGGQGDQTDWPLPSTPSLVTITDDIVRERMVVPGSTPGANPTSQIDTPANLNATPVYRFRRVSEPPVRAVVVALPGFLAGAGSMEPLAVSVIERGHAAGIDVEFWAVDRRSNLLEDVGGMLAAEGEENAEIARGYYYGDVTLSGVPFAGFLDHEAASFASEWGLETHAEDLRRVIGVVAAAERRGHVVLLGHSLGAWMSEAIAAWRFGDGTRGFDELAGIVMIDGFLSGMPLTQVEYEQGFFGPGLPVPGLADLRASSTLVLADGVAPSAWAEIMALRARFQPDNVSDDPERDQLLASYFDLMPDAVPAMTDAAALGFTYDLEYRSIEPITFGLGRTDGPTETYSAQGPFGPVTVARPTDPNTTYGWIDATAVQPVEMVALASLALAWSRGGVNGVEWYFPFRLLLDLYAVRGNAIPETGYQTDNGLRSYDGPLNDAPLMVVAATFPVAAFDTVKGRIAPAVGPGRPQEGADRNSQLGFKTVFAPMLHAETTMASQEAGNPIADELIDFITTHTEASTIVVTPP